MKWSRDSVRTGGVGDLETTELDRRSADSVRHYGKIKEVDYKKNPPVYRAEFGDSKDQDNYILTDWLPASGGRAQGDVSTHFLEVGERVSMHSEAGAMETGHLHPSGTYTENDEQKNGTDKPGVFHHKFKNGQEISLDRESGDFKVIAKGKKKQDSGATGDASGGAGSATSADGSSSGNQEIKGTVTFEAADGSLTMKDGTITGTMGDGSVTLKKDSCVLKIGGCSLTVSSGGVKIEGGGLEVTGGDIKNEGKSVGSTHKHLGVQAGGAQTQGPV